MSHFGRFYLAISIKYKVVLDLKELPLRATSLGHGNCFSPWASFPAAEPSAH